MPYNHLQDIIERINSIGLSGEDKKDFLRKLVDATWPSLPCYSTLTTPVIEEVAKATVGAGVIPVFKENGIYKAVIVEAGSHYQSKCYEADPEKPAYMVAGGFINLSETPGTSMVPANPEKAEDPRTGAVRELEEELVDHEGQPVLVLDPKRLKPMDTKMLSFPWREKRAVIGFMVELTPVEICTVKGHVTRLKKDKNYRDAVSNHTINPETDKPEIYSVSIAPLAEILEGKHPLLHPEQKSLFQLIQNEMQRDGHHERATLFRRLDEFSGAKRHRA